MGFFHPRITVSHGLSFQLYMQRHEDDGSVSLMEALRSGSRVIGPGTASDMALAVIRK